MAEHAADTEQFPWCQHATLTYRRIQLRNNFLLGTQNLVPNLFLIWSFYCIVRFDVILVTPERLLTEIVFYVNWMSSILSMQT